MKIEIFKSILERIRKADQTVNVLYPVVDLTNVTEEYVNVIEMLIKCYYGEEAADNISWFLHEKGGREDIKAFDEDGNEIFKSEEELWADCEELKMSKKEYSLVEPMTDEQRKEMLELITKYFG